MQSGSVMTNLVPGAIVLAKHNETGVYNFVSTRFIDECLIMDTNLPHSVLQTNPETFTHNEVMELMREHVRPSLAWTNFSLEEQGKVLKAPRSNAKLDATKLVKKLGEYGYTVLDSHDALVEAFVEMEAKGLE